MADDRRSYQMKLDIVCPLYHAGGIIEELVRALRAQKGIEIVNAVFPITNAPDAEETAQRIRDAGYTSFTVEKSEFSHSLTRARAMEEFCTSDVVVMMSQDIFFASEESILRLASAISEDTVFAYGRQICKRKTIEHYVRKKNYGEESFLVGEGDIERLSLRAFFASDAFSAYHRPTFLANGGYDGIHMMMNEDMYYARKVLLSGKKKAYVADAVVEHSHKLSLKQLYRRYYATGVWFREHSEFDGYKTTDAGLSLAKYVLKSALCDFNIPVLFRFLPDMAARYLGMRKGKKEAE